MHICFPANRPFQPLRPPLPPSRKHPYPPTAYSAHFDASGNKRHDVLTVAGCVSSLKRWVKFEKQWNATLENAGLPEGTVFHMTDFVSGKKPFDIFKGDSEKRRQLISDLVACMVAHIGAVFSVCIVNADYAAVDEHWLLHENYGPPYSLAGLVILQKTKEWLAKKSSAPVTEFFFEKGDEHQGELDKRSNTHCGIDLNFKTKAEMVQFQPGDLVAWKYRQAATGADLGTKTGDMAKLNSVLRSLDPIRGLYGFNAVYTVDSIIEACKRSGVAKR